MILSFAEANRLAIENKKNGSRLFAKFTTLLEDVLELLDSIPIQIDEQLVEELMSIEKLKNFPELKLSNMTLASFFKCN